MTLIRIGYWRAEHAPEWPDVHDFIDQSWSENERNVVSAYLLSGTAVRHCMGFSPCRICGKQNGNKEFSDGTFIWPEGLAHYIDEHAVRLPPRVVEHACDAMDRLESATVDASWWESLGR
jgi:hypothetical protein